MSYLERQEEEPTHMNTGTTQSGRFQEGLTRDVRTTKIDKITSRFGNKWMKKALRNI